MMHMVRYRWFFPAEVPQIKKRKAFILSPVFQQFHQQNINLSHVCTDLSV